MWQWQHMFRGSLDSTAKSALRSAGAGVDPVAVLVGFRATPDAAFDYCIEPENEPIGQVDLSHVGTRARELLDVDEGLLIVHSLAEAHDPRQRHAQEKAIGLALCAELQRSDAGKGRTFFASYPQLVGDYNVFAVLGVVTERWALLPQLNTQRHDRLDIANSLANAIVTELLDLASRALALREPPRGVAWERASEATDIGRAASSRLMASVASLAGDDFGSQVHEHLDAVAAQPYEGRTGLGTIVLAADPQASGHDDIDIHVRFNNPVSISDTRAFRKVLEMSGEALHVLCDGQAIYGLGRVRDTYDPVTERVFVLTVVGRGSWELTHHRTKLLRLDNTRPHLPRPALSQEQFADTVQRLFEQASPHDVDTLWELAQTAAGQEHGTMLVVHKEASREAERLAPQALAIDPVPLIAEHLRAVTNIDGAVLVSPDGLCHAVGVILDGKATGHGDQARGARYNSAVRYRHEAGKNCLVIIVSEDGMIDLLPNLKPRVHRERVEKALRSMEEAAEGVIDFERFYRRRNHLKTVAFYMDAAQCERANAATERVEDHRAATTPNAMRVYDGRFTPDSELEETHFL